MNKDFLLVLNKMHESAEPFVIVTLVNIKGSAPQEVGARMIVTEQGLKFGTIGGGKLELTGIGAAKEMLISTETTRVLEWNLQKDIGMTCGGVVELFFEKVNPRATWSIAVFGAGHIAQELVPLLLKLDCEIICVDSRKDWLSKLPENNKLKKVQADDIVSAIKNLNPASFIVSLTMGHALDLAVVKEALTNYNFPFVGSIGSEAKSNALKTDLLQSGVGEEKSSLLICPLGLSIGKNQPFEIAISILAQLIQKRDQFE